MTQSINRNDLPEKRQSLTDLLVEAAGPHPLETWNGECLEERFFLKLLAGEKS